MFTPPCEPVPTGLSRQPAHRPPRAGDNALRVMVWLPGATAPTDLPASPLALTRWLLRRYFFARDQTGSVDVGHAGLAAPGIYIGHRPCDLSHLLPQQTIRATAGRIRADVPGYFASLEEDLELCSSQYVSVVFSDYDTDALASFWRRYRRNDAYNLLDRNCSVATALGLDAALGGILANRAGLLQLLRYAGDPLVWGASAIRAAAAGIVWTPSLVHDYALALQRLTQPATVPAIR